MFRVGKQLCQLWTYNCSAKWLVGAQKAVGVAKATMVVWPDLVGCSTPAWSIPPPFMGLGLSFNDLICALNNHVLLRILILMLQISEVWNPHEPARSFVLGGQGGQGKVLTSKQTLNTLKRRGAVRTIWNLTLPLPTIRHTSCKARRVLAWSECALGYARG